MSQVTRTTNQGFFSRLIGSFVGVLIGILMIPGSVLLLSWNEYRTIHRTKGLAEAEKVVVEVPDPNEVDPKSEGKLVHLTGKATTEETLTDSDFSISQVALRLERQVEMYQWVESKQSKSRDKLGGGRETVTTYSYDQKWHAGRVDSEGFEQKDGHVNPPLRFSKQSQTTSRATIGAFQLRPDLVERINEWNTVAIDLPKMLESKPEDQKSQYSAEGEYLYCSVKAPKSSSPEVGDVRIRFQVVNPTQISLLTKQVERKLAPFQTSNKETIESLAIGTRSATDMVNDLRQENTIFAIILRVAGWVLACVGFGLIIGPIKALANVIPFLASLVGIATGAIAFILGSVLALMTIAVAWVAVRPVFSICLIGFSVFGLFVLLRRRKPALPPMATLVDG